MQYLRFNSPTVNNDSKKCTVDKAEARGVNPACEKCVNEDPLSAEIAIGDTANQNEGTAVETACGETYEDVALLTTPANPPVYDLIMKTDVTHPLFVYEDTDTVIATIGKHGFVTTKGQCDKYGQTDTYMKVYGEAYDATVQMYAANTDTVLEFSKSLMEKYLKASDPVDFYLYSPPVADGLQDGKRDGFRTMLTGAVFDAIYADAVQYINIYLHAAQTELYQIPVVVIAEMVNNVPITEVAYRAAVTFIVWDAFYDITEEFISALIEELTKGTENETYVSQVLQLSNSLGVTGSIANPISGTGYGGYPTKWGATKRSKAPDVKFFLFDKMPFTGVDLGNLALMCTMLEGVFNAIIVQITWKYRWRV